MMQLLEISSYWLDRFYIYFHPLIIQKTYLIQKLLFEFKLLLF
jgi:hypothetical protein